MYTHLTKVNADDHASSRVERYTKVSDEISVSHSGIPDSQLFTGPDPAGLHRERCAREEGPGCGGEERSEPAAPNALSTAQSHASLHLDQRNL